LLLKPYAAFTDPALKLSRIAVDQGIIGDIPGNYCPGTDESMTAYGVPANDGSIGTDSCSLSNQRGLEFMLSRNMAPGIYDIGEDTGGATENIVL